MAEATRVPNRSEVPASDTWDLSALFPGPEAWEEGLKQLEGMIPGIAGMKELMGSSPQSFAAVLAAYRDFGLLDERLGYYASLREAEDQGDDSSRGRMARYMSVATRASGEWAFLVPAIQALDESFVERCLASEGFAEYAIFLRRIIRQKPHVLSEAEEKLLALQIESAQTASDAFEVLTNVDLDFGSLDTPEGPKPLTQSSYQSFMRSPEREIRKKAYFRFYEGFDKHKNTLAALYSGSVKQDKYRATVRRFGSARQAALFPDDVSESVYDNLVSTVSANLPLLHGYYELRKKLLKVEELRHYDVYVPLLPEAKARHTYPEAVDAVCRALAPLGKDYVATLRSGLERRWVDCYENKGKRSGAFSAGSFAGEPYILLNHKEDLLHDVFTIAHEGGHSMHSWYSARSNPFLCYGYTIFEAEVASTFNEQLLFKLLYEEARDDGERASLVGAQIDLHLASLFRQTMFAEFEARSHAIAEAGESLTLDVMRSEYRKLLQKYFGPAMVLEDASDLECLRIPHFYRAFYVYKYATGISASIALSNRVLSGGDKERDDYFAFLKSGGSRFPIESLKVAGVDMSTPGPVEAACAEFGRLCSELRRLLKI